MVARALTIAGSDVSGGAGLEADLKMFEEFGVFGTAVVTCIVTFDPEKDFEHAIDFMETEVIARQLKSALAVHSFDALKSGMLGTAESALQLARYLEGNSLPYVFDPVLVCKGSGTMVDLKDLFVENLVPQATVITPNLEEAATLLGAEKLETEADLVEAAKAIHALGAAGVVVKGGARLDGDEAVDVFYDGYTLVRFSTPKVSDALVNGAGCSFASAIAAGLAQGASAVDAVAEAKEVVTHAIAGRLPNATGVPSTLHPAARLYPAEGVAVTAREL
ncbi:PfkB family carbohydrate kinase [Sediminivirga luteola]|uniref:pyridoxal kinase n=1 Tax=Sediminivirga luteola TaxID=1774748 RepID=A0A8J2TWQ3_9MICO|nr:PfkB family carbohydrate kinase [Sediminivirga luteola]GGA08878.1 hydroxymethylpyrimidine/phosphomethylpyrimidine kinase [Sediminivirga luteola]